MDFSGISNPIDKVDYITVGAQYALLSKVIHKIGIDVSGLPLGASLTLDRCGDVYLTVGGGPGAATGISGSSKVGGSAVIGSYDSPVDPEHKEAQKQMINLLEGPGEESMTMVAYGGVGKLKSSGGTATEYAVGSPSLGSSTVAGLGVLLYKNPNPTNNIYDAVKSLGFITSDQIIEQNPKLKDALDNLNQGIQNFKNEASSILNGNFVSLDKNASMNIYANAALDNANGNSKSSVEQNQTRDILANVTTALAISDLPRNPHSKVLFDAYTKEALTKGDGCWTAEINKTIAENMLKDGVRPQRVEQALKHSPEPVENPYYFVKNIKNSHEVQVAQQSRGRGIC